MNDIEAKILKQNEVIISLLGRIAFKKEEVVEIVTKKKQNPENYIRGYNACDGEHGVTEIARIVGVKQPTLSPILNEWEELGIIFDTGKPGGKFYRRIFPLEFVLSHCVSKQEQPTKQAKASGWL